jgi:competence protein ComEC
VVALGAALRWGAGRAWRIAACACLALGLGLGSGSRFWQETCQDAQALQAQALGGAWLQVASDPSAGSLSPTSTAHLVAPDGRAATVRVYWPPGQTPLALGQTFSADCTFKPLHPGNQNLFQKGVCGSVALDAAALQPAGYAGGPFDTLVNRALSPIYELRAQGVRRFAAMGSAGADLLCGMVLGYDGLLADSPTMQDWRTTGLAHLIAVSGSHLVVIAAMLSWLLRALHVGRRANFAILAALLSAYVVLTAFQPSAIRAAIMAIVAAGTFLTERRAHSPSALSCAACAMLLIDPGGAFSIGLWLSICAVFGLGLYSSLVKEWLQRIFWPKRPGSATGNRQTPGRAAACTLPQPIARLFEAAALTTTAQAATAPLCVATFGMFPLVSIAANLLVTPLVTIMVGAGILLCVLAALPCLGPLAATLLTPLSILGDAAGFLTGLLAGLPFASLPVTAPLPLALGCGLALAALVYAFWPLPRPAVLRGLAATGLSVAFVLCILLPNTSGPRLVVMDVGQGDALLVRQGPRTLLVDTGPSDGALVKALARQQVTHLDAVVLTHLDADHVDALDALRGQVGVERVFFAAGLLTAKPQHPAIQTARTLAGGERVSELSAGDLLPLSPNLQLRVVWPIAPATKGDNSESLCLLLEYDAERDGIPETRSLLTGDAETQELAGAMTSGWLSQSSIYKVGHHGSADGITPAQLEALGCRISLISCGARNRYGHPAPSTLETLAQADQLIYRTDLQGDLTLEFSGPDVKVLTQR